MIAIIDYGIGGLGLYKMIRKDFPKLPLIYFSDSGEIPYGKLSKRALRARIEKVFAFLENEGADKIIVACHSASSVVKDSDKNTVGLRSQTVKAVTKRKPKSVGIIGGGRTIRSGFYKRELNKVGIKTSQRVAQPLSILVERGEVEGILVEEAVKKIMKPLDHCDSILLACTHYPVLSGVFKKYTNAKLIDPVKELYDSIYKDLVKMKTRGKTKFITTGDANLMQIAAKTAFHIRIAKPFSVTF
ncbi:MAG: aspartate/glutamate racemase family protein [Bacteroidota bacterium]